MALQKQVELSSGIVLEEAYHRLVSVQLDYVSKVFQLVINIYVNESLRREGKNCILTNYFNNEDRNVFDQFFSVEALNISEQNPIERGYEYLKTLPDYEEAVNV